MSLPGCPDFGSVPGFADPITIVPQPCSAFRASDLIWALRGFEPKDMLNPDDPNPQQLIALLRVGQVKTLHLTAGSVGSSEDCSGKATGVEWSSSNTVVARIEVGSTRASGVLTALQPGDTVVWATLTFQDGTPPMRLQPYAFTNAASGLVAVVRVTP
jgi:hypothetical protein